MSNVMVVDRCLRVRFTRAEKVMGLVHDFSVPLDRVTFAEPLSPPWRQVVRGWRIGLGLPGVRLIGTWRTRGLRQLVDLRRSQPAVRVVLRPGSQYDELLVSTPHAREVLDQIHGTGAGTRQSIVDE